MDVKDINNQTNPLALFKKQIGTAVSGFDFMELINNKKSDFGAADLPTGLDSVKAKASPDKASPELKTASVEKNDSLPKKIAKKKNKAAPLENTEKPAAAPQKTPAENSEAIAVQPVAATPADKMSANPVAETAAETIAPITETIAPETMPAESLVPVEMPEVSAAELSAMGDIMFMDPQTGTWAQTTGAELVSRMASGEINTIASTQIAPVKPEQTIAVSAETPANLLSASGIEIPQEMEILPENEVFAAQTAEHEVSSKPIQENVSEAIDVSDLPADEVLKAQASELADLTGDGKKVQVKVDIKGEKITYQASQERLSDILAVDQAVAEVASQPKMGEAVSTANPQPTASATNGTSPANQNPAAFIAPAVFAQNLNAEVSAPQAAAKAVSELSSVSSASVAGSEFVNAAKAGTASEAKTAVQDNLKSLGREVVEQVKVNITKSAVKGIDKIDVSLKPEELGRIEIKMQIAKDGKLHAHIVASRPETMEILQKDAQALQKAFNDAGFQTDEGSLSFAFREEGSAYQDQEQNAGLRQFMGNMFEQETGNDNISAALYDEAAWDGKSGLNIRV